MKRIIALLMVLILSLSLCACGSDAMPLSKKAVEEAFESCDGELDIEADGDDVSAILFTAEEANVDDLVNRDYLKGGIKKLLSGETGDLTYGELRCCYVVLPVMESLLLIKGEEFAKEKFDADVFIEEMLDIICDGDVAEYNGWTLTVEIDKANDSAKVMVVS